MAGTGKFGVVITHGNDDPDRATVGFVVADAAAGSDQETAVFLYNDAVNIAFGGYADEIHEEGFVPLSQLLGDFLAAGGQLYACGMCVDKRGLERTWLIDGARIVGSGKLIEFLADGTPAVTY